MESDFTPERDISLRHARIASFGASLGTTVREQTTELFAAIPRTYGTPAIARDLRYGPHPRHRLDVHYRAARAQQQLSPVLCYVHGGGFTGGDKTKPGQPYYDNVGAWAVGVGFVGVTITYRYAPESTYPAGAEDIARALSFIEEEIADFGGDPRWIVVMGHSAGAAHVATLVANRSLRAGITSGPAGAILSSGVYDPSIVPSAYREYFGVDQGARQSMSAIPGLVATEIPLLISSAQFDPPETLSHTRKLLRAFDEGEAVIPLYVQVDGHNHYSVIYQFNSAEQWYTGRIFRFVNSLAPVA